MTTLAPAPPVVRLHSAPNARAGLVLSHGVMSHAGWFDTLAERLVARGISVAAVDRAGSGLARDRAGACDAETWVADLAAAAESLALTIPKVSLLGWCWGARAAILAAKRWRPSQLVLVAPGLAMAANVRARASALAQTVGPRLGLPFEIEAFSDDARVLAWIREDPLAWRDQPREFLAPSRAIMDEVLRVLPKLDVPTTVILARGDRLIDNLGIERMIAPRTAEYLAGGHALVLESPDVLAERVARALLP